MNLVRTYAIRTPFIHGGAGLLACGLLVATAATQAGELDVPNSFAPGTPALSAEVNENFTAIETAVNDNHGRIEALESPGYTTIQHISWVHDGAVSASTVINDGLAIAFSRPVRFEELSDPLNTRMFRLEQFSEPFDWVGFTSIFVLGAFNDYSTDPEGTIVDWTPIAAMPSDFVNGLYVRPTSLSLLGVYRVVIRGNFLIDETGRAVDADFLRAETPTGDGVEGGIFESWFNVN